MQINNLGPNLALEVFIEYIKSHALENFDDIGQSAEAEAETMIEDQQNFSNQGQSSTEVNNAGSTEITGNFTNDWPTEFDF